MVKSAIQALEILSSIPANDGDVAAFGLAAVVEECSYQQRPYLAGLPKYISKINSSK